MPARRFTSWLKTVISQFPRNKSTSVRKKKIHYSRFRTVLITIVLLLCQKRLLINTVTLVLFFKKKPAQYYSHVLRTQSPSFSLPSSSAVKKEEKRGGGREKAECLTMSLTSFISGPFYTLLFLLFLLFLLLLFLLLLRFLFRVCVIFSWKGRDRPGRKEERRGMKVNFLSR